MEKYLEGDEGDDDDEEEVEEYPEGDEDPLPADLAVSPPLLRPEQEQQPCNI